MVDDAGTSEATASERDEGGMDGIMKSLKDELQSLLSWETASASQSQSFDSDTGSARVRRHNLGMKRALGGIVNCCSIPTEDDTKSQTLDDRNDDDIHQLDEEEEYYSSDEEYERGRDFIRNLSTVMEEETVFSADSSFFGQSSKHRSDVIRSPLSGFKHPATIRFPLSSSNYTSHADRGTDTGGNLRDDVRRHMAEEERDTTEPVFKTQDGLGLIFVSNENDEYVRTPTGTPERAVLPQSKTSPMPEFPAVIKSKTAPVFRSDGEPVVTSDMALSSLGIPSLSAVSASVASVSVVSIGTPNATSVGASSASGSSGGKKDKRKKSPRPKIKQQTETSKSRESPKGSEASEENEERRRKRPPRPRGTTTVGTIEGSEEERKRMSPRLTRPGQEQDRRQHNRKSQGSSKAKNPATSRQGQVGVDDSIRDRPVHVYPLSVGSAEVKLHGKREEVNRKKSGDVAKVSVPTHCLVQSATGVEMAMASTGKKVTKLLPVGTETMVKGSRSDGSSDTSIKATTSGDDLFDDRTKDGKHRDKQVIDSPKRREKQVFDSPKRPPKKQMVDPKSPTNSECGSIKASPTAESTSSTIDSQTLAAYINGSPTGSASIPSLLSEESQNTNSTGSKTRKKRRYLIFRMRRKRAAEAAEQQAAEEGMKKTEEEASGRQSPATLRDGGGYVEVGIQAAR